MRSFLINKNLSLYYRLKKRIGKRIAFRLAYTIEKAILILGREQMPQGKKGIYRRVKQFGLILGIKKTILIWKLINSSWLMR